MYTNRDVVRVVMFTDTYRVEGNMHVLSGSRLTDALNAKMKDFFALTEARVLGLVDDRVLYETPYIAVNRESISCVIPLEPSGLAASSGD